MKVKEFCAIAEVSRFFAFTQGGFSRRENAEKPLCPNDFRKKYWKTDLWNAEIERIEFIPCQTGEISYHETVLCLIELKRSSKDVRKD